MFILFGPCAGQEAEKADAAADKGVEKAEPAVAEKEEPPSA